MDSKISPVLKSWRLKIGAETLSEIRGWASRASPGLEVSKVLLSQRGRERGTDEQRQWQQH
jgi:hypothetical protein